MATAAAPHAPKRPRIARAGDSGQWVIEVTTPGGLMLFYGETIEEALETAVNGLTYFLYHPHVSPPGQQPVGMGRS